MGQADTATTNALQWMCGVFYHARHWSETSASDRVPCNIILQYSKKIHEFSLPAALQYHCEMLIHLAY